MFFTIGTSALVQPAASLPLLALDEGVAVVDGKIEARMLMPVTLSYDHRVIDGGAAARFTVDLLAAMNAFSADDVKL